MFRFFCQFRYRKIGQTCILLTRFRFSFNFINSEEQNPSLEQDFNSEPIEHLFEIENSALAEYACAKGN